MSRLGRKKIREFQRLVRKHFRTHGRQFAWRTTYDPYHILVSEIMLQQTQTFRVEPKFKAFIAAFPTLADLARAPLADVYTLWQGLGYNRRARMLRDAAKAIIEQHGGEVPQDLAALKQLPGVGPYTASAIAAFAFNARVVVIETNIRAVYLYHFFPKKPLVGDSDIIPLIETTLPARNSRQWYASLMDYGAHLKATQTNPSRRSKHHTKQSRFQGSVREVRGAIVRTALGKPSFRLADLHTATGYPLPRIEQALLSLVKDGTLVQKNDNYVLAN